MVKILGVTYNAMGISTEMWTRLARDITASVDRARGYARPMAERRYLAHSVFCGRLWYLTQVVLPARNFIRQVRSSLFRFFWMEKTELVTRQVLSLLREERGWGFPRVNGTPALLQLRPCSLSYTKLRTGPDLSLSISWGTPAETWVSTSPARRLPVLRNRPRLAGKRFNWTSRQHQRHASPKHSWNYSSPPCRLDSRIRCHGSASPPPTFHDTCATSSGSAAGECFPHETAYFGGACLAPINAQTATTERRTCMLCQSVW